MRLRYIYLGIVGVVLLGAGVLFFAVGNDVRSGLEHLFSRTTGTQTAAVLGPTELSGWVAQWEETQAYQMLDEKSPKLKLIEPQWFFVNKEFGIDEVGVPNKAAVVKHLADKGIEVLVLMSSNLTGAQLSPLLHDKTKSGALAQAATEKAKALGATGIDVDLELIRVEDKQAFIVFLNIMVNELHSRNMKMSVCVHAQTGWDDWEGFLGHDIRRIGKIADEVHVMAYDKHSEGTTPGPIAPPDWVADVARFSLLNIPPEKLVMGLASYGYIWPDHSTAAEPMLYNEFMSRVKNDGYTQKRDPDSQELMFKKPGYEGWVSDHIAIEARIELLRTMEINKFIVWNLSGIDAELFRQKL